MFKSCFLFILVCSISMAKADEISVKDLKYEGFIDTSYAYDFKRPQDSERQYTTQPSRHNEANINLAYLSTGLEREKVRGKLTLQFGTSVVKNYSTDPVLGSTSGPDKNRMFQEAYVGTRLSEKSWLDGGIYLGNIGMESFISKYNYTYTRSLMLDFVPYYSSGLRLSTQHTDKTSTQVHLMNGWQNISENNQDKALGFQFSHIFSDTLTFTYNNFIGNEPRTPRDPSKLRTYNDFIFNFKFTDKWKFNYSADIGTHERSMRDGTDVWYATAGVLRYQFVADQGVAFRLEYYNDKDQSNIITGSEHGFRTVGASVNYDKEIDQRVLWRTEFRTFNSKDPIYPNKDKFSHTDSFIVTSLALTI